MNKLFYHPFPDAITAFSTTRAAGGNGVHPWRIVENLQPIVEELQTTDDCLVVPHQTHTTNILHADEAFMRLSAAERLPLLEEKDAVVTHLVGVCVCVSTADCIPVLLYDASHQVVAAIHAGWRGTCGRIVEKTCEFMRQQYGTCGNDLHAVIGPGISLEAFEVGDEVFEAFRGEGHDMRQIARRFPARDVPEKWHIDLWACNRLQLCSFGVPANQVHVSGICTVQHSDTFFSARSLGVHSGRILNGIRMNKQSNRHIP